MQVTDATLSFSPHDVFMDLIVTPERVLETTPDADRPAGIDWDELGDDQRAEIPILETLE